MGSIGDPALLQSRELSSNTGDISAAGSGGRGSGSGGRVSGGRGSGQAGMPASGGGAPGASSTGGGSGPGSSAGAAGSSGQGAVASRGMGNVSSMLKARSDMAVLRDLKIGPLLGRGSYGRVYKGEQGLLLCAAVCWLYQAGALVPCSHLQHACLHLLFAVVTTDRGHEGTLLTLKCLHTAAACRSLEGGDCGSEDHRAL
jgi:hypothetical protein